MKIYCEQCHEDITLGAERMISNYDVGNLICPKCNHKQKRYISESDILLSFGINEISYYLISIGIIYSFGYSKSIPLTIVIVLCLLLLAYFIQSITNRLIYTKAHFKKAYKDRKIMEDNKTIKKNMNWQFMLFIALSVMFITDTSQPNMFHLLSFACIGLTFVKYFLCLRKEKKITK